MASSMLAAREASQARSRHRSSGEHLDTSCRSATSPLAELSTSPLAELVGCSRGGFALLWERWRLVGVSLWLGMFTKQIS